MIALCSSVNGKQFHRFLKRLQHYQVFCRPFSLLSGILPMAKPRLFPKTTHPSHNFRLASGGQFQNHTSEPGIFQLLRIRPDPFPRILGGFAGFKKSRLPSVTLISIVFRLRHCACVGDSRSKFHIPECSEKKLKIF
jgi:hypothetical protein